MREEYVAGIMVLVLLGIVVTVAFRKSGYP